MSRTAATRRRSSARAAARSSRASSTCRFWGRFRSIRRRASGGIRASRSWWRAPRRPRRTPSGAWRQRCGSAWPGSRRRSCRSSADAGTRAGSGGIFRAGPTDVGAATGARAPHPDLPAARGRLLPGDRAAAPRVRASLPADDRGLPRGGPVARRGHAPPRMGEGLPGPPAGACRGWRRGGDPGGSVGRRAVQHPARWPGAGPDPGGGRPPEGRLYRVARVQRLADRGPSPDDRTFTDASRSCARPTRGS